MIKAITTDSINKQLTTIERNLKFETNKETIDKLEKTREFLNRILNNETSARSYETLLNYYNKFINKKNKDEVNPEDWEFYRDYHKEVFGFEPEFLKFGI